MVLGIFILLSHAYLKNTDDLHNRMYTGNLVGMVFIYLKNHSILSSIKFSVGNWNLMAFYIGNWPVLYSIHQIERSTAQ